ncbi:MAG: hypothetical protein JSU57_05755 [Candidatus Heimdallarchaeota archaeon]|nr:MAG: hypothetical protein JSU57_05755 [Candidatus Heimdallarchaeota archaeon]
MKKKIYLGISGIMLIMVLIFTVPAQASPTEWAGPDFSEDHFAIELDLVGDGKDIYDPQPDDPDLIRDLLDPDADIGDRNELEDLQFYLAYMNDTGIETAYSALEKFEHELTFRDLLHPTIEGYLEAYDLLQPLIDLKPALDKTIFHVNATAPFQQLVQHYTTPAYMGSQDTFVTNNFMALIAYRMGTGSDPAKLDTEDDLYLGYTFSIQELIEGINNALDGKTEYEVGNFGYSPIFDETDDGFMFGMNYTNMLVLWQKIDAVPNGIDILGMEDLDTGGIIFGQDIVAASVLDYLAYVYEFETQEFTGANTYVEGTVTSHYYIGETNFLIVNETTIPTGINGFLAQPSYTFDVPLEVQGLDLSAYGIDITLSAEITITLPELACYVGDDAKRRMKEADGFGLTVATATNTFGAEEIDAGFNDTTDEADNQVGIYTGGNTYFFTAFTDKDTYKLQGLDDIWPDINPDVDRDVVIRVLDHNDWSNWDTEGVAEEYFIVELGMSYLFTEWMATQLSLQLTDIATSVEDLLSDTLYFIGTEFPEWHGGEIIHDPTYSAIAALAAQPPETTTTTEETEGPPPSSSEDGVPGFEILSVLIILPPLYALTRKRRH